MDANLFIQLCSSYLNEYENKKLNKNVGLLSRNMASAAAVEQMLGLKNHTTLYLSEKSGLLENTTAFIHIDKAYEFFVIKYFLQSLNDPDNFLKLRSRLGIR